MKRRISWFLRSEIQRVDYFLFRRGMKSTSRSRRALSWANHEVCMRLGFWWSRER